MSTLSLHARRPARRHQRRHAPYGHLLLDQFSHNLQDLWRSRIVFVFTLMFPLTWLVVLGLVMGNDTVDEATGIPIMQFLTPTAAAMGILFAAYPTVATALAAAREDGVLKRIHGTPMPTWVFLAGRIAAAVVFAFVSFIVMITVGTLLFDVDLIGRTALATAVTSMVAIASFAAVGLAVATLASSAATAQAASIASTVVLAFLSGLMGFGDMPAWADRIAAFFPIRPFNDAFREQFNPLGTGAGWDIGALAVMAAWGLAAAVVAERAFRWDPAVRHTTRRQHPRLTTKATLPSRAASAVSLASTPRRGTGHPLLAQIRWANRGTLRNPGSMFFAVAMPLTLFAFMMSVYDRKSTGPAGEPIDVYTLCGLASWGAAVVGFVYLPEAIAGARETGVLKRLRGTPLNPSTYLAGHAASALWTALITGVLLVVEGLLFFNLEIDASGLPTAAAILLLGTASIAATGFLLASLVPSRKAASAVGLGILFPVSFISNVFVAGDMPAWLDTVGSLLPLKHLAHSLVTAVDPAGTAVSWTGVAVMTVWLVVGALLAVRLFRWETR
jgi:ABC-type multidrug transport system permease subunit